MNHDILYQSFNKIGVDTGKFQEHNYLVEVYFYSRWIEAIRINSKNSTTIINNIKEIFSRFGIPKLMVADNVQVASLEMKPFPMNRI